MFIYLMYVFVLQIVFTGVRGSAIEGDIAMDDLRITAGACSGKLGLNLSI